MKSSLPLTLLALFSILPAFAQKPIVKPEDFSLLTGERWTGSLVYRDYGSNKEVSIPSHLTVTKATAEDLTWIFEYEYPQEPKANSKENVKLTTDGTRINDENVVARENLDDGVLRLVTERLGKDNDRNALIRHTYLIGRSSFSIKKEVRPEDSTKFFERNRYTWRR